MTTPTQILIDSDIKERATELFDLLGLDLSSAINFFLYQCILRGGLPFSVELPKYNQETLKAIIEGKAIANDPSVKGYTNMEDLKKALIED